MSARAVRLATVLAVLLGLAWGVSENDSAVSLTVGVAPPADDATRRAIPDTSSTPDTRDDPALPAALALAPFGFRPRRPRSSAASPTSARTGVPRWVLPARRGPPIVT